MAEPSTRMVTFQKESLDARPNALPRELTSFVGREREVDEVKRLLATTSLLTLTGSGGSGKTRLSQRVAADLAESYPDGLWLVELAPLGDDALVPQAVASALGIREQPGRALTDTLIDVLRPRNALLLLDNCEHLVAVCAVLADSLLRACPRLGILATSREPLVVAGETVWRVPPLAMPDLPNEPSIAGRAARVGQAEAVRLFEDRARAASPSFKVTDQNAAAVAQICRRLDGIPLAIELAAARVRGLAPEQLAARLDDHLRLLTGGSRAALLRHQTMRALVDWSYELLSEPERVLFRRLSVFAGGWTLDAAERACADASPRSGQAPPSCSRQAIEPEDVMGLLLQLVDRSLVLADDHLDELDGEPGTRYRLLETLRQYGAEKLREDGEEHAARARHLAWCLELVTTEGGVALHGPDGTARARRLETEHDNFRVALGWSLSSATSPAEKLVGLRITALLWELWWMHAHLSEGDRWLTTALAADVGDHDDARRIRARALVGAALLTGLLREWDRSSAYNQETFALVDEDEDPYTMAYAIALAGIAAEMRGDHDGAIPYYERGLEFARAKGLDWLAGWGLGHFGRMALDRGEYQQATALLEESIVLLRRAGDRHGMTWSLLTLARVAERTGDLVRANAIFEEGLTVAREYGDRLVVAWFLGSLGRVARGQGDYARATSLIEQSLAVSRDVGDRWGATWALRSLGRVALAQHDYQRAAALFEECLVLCRDLRGRRRHVSYSLHHLGTIASLHGHPERAVRLYGASDLVRTASGWTLAPSDLAERERRLAEARQALGTEQVAAAWAAGQALSLDDAIELGLASPPVETPPVYAPPPALSQTLQPQPPAATPPPPSPLSARELEVAALLARGLTNRQVAAVLVISDRTASTHVAHILDKLNFSSRSQIAAWAAEHGLTAPAAPSGP